MVVYGTFLRDVAYQKLLNSANVSRSYSQNNTGTVFMRILLDDCSVDCQRDTAYHCCSLTGL